MRQRLLVLALGLVALAAVLAWTLFVRDTPAPATGPTAGEPPASAEERTDPLLAVPGDAFDDDAPASTGEARVAVEQATVGEPMGPRSLWGWVQDGDARVIDFLLTAEPLAAPSANGPVHVRVEDRSGHFELDLPPGRWQVSASFGRRPSGEPVIVQVPREEPLVLRRAPLGSVSGVVLDPYGVAAVEATVANASRRGRQDLSATTGVDGSFELGGVYRGEHELVATLEGFAPSEPVRVSVPEGEHVRDVRITLRVGARLRGRVLDRSGRPEFGTTVEVSSRSPATGSRPGVETDAAGAFEFAHLAPGTWQVGVEADFSGETRDGPLRLEVLELAEGDDVEIVLGGLLTEQVRVRGVGLAADGTPLEGADLVTLAEGEGLLQSANQVELGPDGRFDVTLAFPGRFVFALDAGGRLQTFPVQVPASGLDDLRLVLPGGTIAGRLFMPTGAPAGGAMVGAWRAEGADVIERLGEAQTTESQEDGSFVFTGLPAGTWWLASEGGGVMGFLDDPVALAENGLVEGVEIRLESVGALAGHVLGADGEPVAGASVFARDGAGRWVLPRGRVTQQDGRFSVPVPEGRYTLLARATRLASQESERVEVVAGESAQVELVLAPATRLEVALIDPRGALVPARFRVEDASGRLVSGILAAHAREQILSEGFSSLEPRFGPFAPGTYRVLATTEGGSTASAQVSVGGELLRRIELRLE